jgi:hypothetical protein
LNHSSKRCATANRIVQSNENIFMSDLPANTPLSNDNGFASLFDAAAKGDAGIFMLMPGDARVVNIVRNSGLPSTGPRLRQATVSKTPGPSLRRCGS